MDFKVIARLKKIYNTFRIRICGIENNKIRKGLNTQKKLNKGFYHFIYEKNIDWAIFLGSFFLLLPYVASKIWYFLLLKIFFLLLILYLIGKYLLTWNKLRQFYLEQERFKKSMKELINNKKLDDSSNLLDNLTIELNKISVKAQEKKHLYKNFNDYLVNEKADFEPIEKLLNEDSETSKTALGLMLSTVVSILTIREIPIEEKKNYRRILMILLTIGLFFIIYYFETWYN